MGIFLFMISLLTYINAFTNGFMFDDFTCLFGQYSVAGRSFADIFMHNQAGFYRPVGHLLLWISAGVFGNNVIGYHAVNFCLFLLMLFFFVIIAEKLTQNRMLAFMAGLLYAVHPINGMSVNYITACNNSSYVLLMQLSLISYIYYTESRRKYLYVLSFIGFILAFLAHEIALLLPFFLIAYRIVCKGARLKPSFYSVAPFIVLAGCYFLFRSNGTAVFVHKINIPISATGDLMAYFSTWVDLIRWYFTQLIYPAKVVFLWSAKMGSARFIVNAAIFLLGSIGFCYFIIKNGKNWKSFALLLFLGGCAPTFYSCFVFSPKVWPYFEPHWMYFSQMGFFILAGAFFYYIIKRNRLVGHLLIVAVLCLFIVCSWQYNSKWRTQEEYSRYWLSVNQGNLTAFYGLGTSLMDKGDYAGAVDVFRSANTLLGNISVAMAVALGHCYDELGNGTEALVIFNTVTKENPGNALVYHYKGLYLMKRGDHALAREAFLKSVKLDPKFSLSYPYLQDTRLKK